MFKFVCNNIYTLKRSDDFSRHFLINKPCVIPYRAPVSSEISDLCEISDLLLFLSYFASQNKEIKPGNYFFDVCCVN